MKNKMTKIIALLLTISVMFSLVACGNNEPIVNDDDSTSSSTTDSVDESNQNDESENENLASTDNSLNVVSPKPLGVSGENNSTNKDYENNDSGVAGDKGVISPTGEYNEGFVLVKVKKNFDKASLGELEYISYEPLFNGSKWYSVELKDSTTQEAVEYLSDLGTFEKVDYDYIMGVGSDDVYADVSDNPNYVKQNNHTVHKIPKGWDEFKKNGKHPGGSEDVIIAVIDTGVDYNHLDLRNNIWTNTAEIAGNGKDDDGNGYIDDINGWNCVGDNNNPMDDNGHGTHVAGIIAAENNKIGGVGVAYNCKVMVLKAGNSSGYFNNSDIAEAVQYAYMNGASVINMSFGGSSISIAVEEALENAYNTSILVAAAGNDSACNNISCDKCDVKKVSYPAALPYVIGVMSVGYNGETVSTFSNYDHDPYNSIEYEVYAVGEAIPSTWPGNRYATLNGTSMAAPTVAGIAALLRSVYPDRNTYSTKFIQSQIVNTGTEFPYNYFTEEVDGAHSVVDVYEAATKLPKPEVNLYDYSIDDSATISAKNNGNGVVDAGETVRLYVALHNRGGVASNINVTIDTARSEDFELTDPYFTLKNTAITLSDIGTYSVRESGDKYFEIVVSSDCPNDYLANFNIRFTYKNGMDEKDNATYSGKGKAQFNVSSGYLLPATITEDTVFTADHLYIVGEDVIIPEGVTITFEEGCQIQFYDDREYYNSPRFVNYGTLEFNGTKDNMIKIAPNEKHATFAYGIKNYGVVSLDYVEAINIILANAVKDTTITVTNSFLREQKHYESTFNGVIWSYKNAGTSYQDLIKNLLGCTTQYGNFNLSDTYFEYAALNCRSYSYLTSVSNCFAKIANRNGNLGAYAITKFINNIVYCEDYYSSTNSCTLNVKEFENNRIIIEKDSAESLIKLKFSSPDLVNNNEFGKIYQKYVNQVIDGYYDSTGTPTVDVYGSLSDESLLWPHVTNVEMFNKDGELVTTVGREEVKVRVTFNRPMDTTKDTFLTFGTIEPYADYRIDGEYISETVWEGTYTLKAQIENGQNFLKVNNACAKEDQTKKVFGEYQLHEFTIDTTAAMSMNLQAIATAEGINLTWAQDEYDTLLGYNIYRSEEKDGNFVKLNPAILLPTDESFLDENAEPGKTYWYTYTVVLSDFTESKPAGKIFCTAYDTMSPSLYHTPVNQGYENNNLVISCTASDNVAIKNVTLYYRTVGDAQWKTLSMVKNNDKYSATIFGSEVTLAGLEYYIVATDGNNEVNKGSAETPYIVIVKSVDTLSKKGDVDGNGVISTKDALMIMQYINGDLLLSDDEFQRANLNGDNVLSSVEALRILQYINGNVNTLDM